MNDLAYEETAVLRTILGYVEDLVRLKFGFLIDEEYVAEIRKEISRREEIKKVQS